MSTLQELLARAEHKQAAAAEIRRVADKVSARALQLEIQYDDEVAALTEAIALLERAPADHADEIAELTELCDSVGLEMADEPDSERGEPAASSESSDDSADDSDFTPDAATVSRLRKTIEKGWTDNDGDESADDESDDQ